MLTVYKYPLILDDWQDIDLPVGARSLAVQMQHGVPQLWALVDPAAPLVPRRFRIAGTGHPINLGADGTRLDYIGTFQLQAGALVFHLFELGAM